MRFSGRLIAWSIPIGALGLLGAAVVQRRYQRDIREAYRRLDGRRREVVETECGIVEYAAQGEGDPVLVIHGIAGGFDQGLDTAAAHLGSGLRTIAPSRFGYLGTHLPPDATPASQADVLACLLDHMRIDRAGVIAYSAGGPSAIQLALRHPERVAALVLVSTSPSGEQIALPPRPMIEAVFRSDFVLWLLTHPLRPLMQPMVGVPRGYPLTKADRQAVTALMDSILPIAPRARGHIFDMYTSNVDQARHPDLYPLEAISAPTLLINAADDPLADCVGAERASRRIPHARLVTVPRGGHIFLGGGDLVGREVTAFLRDALAVAEPVH